MHMHIENRLLNENGFVYIPRIAMFNVHCYYLKS